MVMTGVLLSVVIASVVGASVVNHQPRLGDVDLNATLLELLKDQQLDTIALNNSIGMWIAVRTPTASISVALGAFAAMHTRPFRVNGTLVLVPCVDISCS